MNTMAFTSLKLSDSGLYDLGEGAIGQSLQAACLDCIQTQRIAAARTRELYRADPSALGRVSPEALDSLLQRDANVHGLASDRDLSNAICFAAPHIAGSVNDPAVLEKLRLVDRLMASKVRELFATWKDLVVKQSGVFWYPPGCSMGWHTNSKAVGWRIYINYAEQEGESFFRYRDPHSAEIITLPDKTWNCRVFRVSASNPLWHCIYSNTNRFSIGYRVLEPSFGGALLKKVRKGIRRHA
jgi:hypothetical protein